MEERRRSNDNDNDNKRIEKKALLLILSVASGSSKAAAHNSLTRHRSTSIWLTEVHLEAGHSQTDRRRLVPEMIGLAAAARPMLARCS